MTFLERWRAGLLALGVFIACAPYVPARAQNILPPQVLDPAVRTAQPPATPRAGDILGPPAPGPCPLASSDLQFTLTAVEFTGAADLAGRGLENAYAGLAGRQIPVRTICEIRDRAAAILFQRGLLARVEIPQQTIMGGRVTFTVIEAYIAAIVVRGNAGPAQEKVADYIEMLRGLRPFDINRAQRYLLLASDIPGIVLSATLRPSAEAPGAVELDVDVSHVAADAVLNINNLGSKSAGRTSALLRGDLNSVTSFGERTSIIAYSAIEGPLRAQQVIQGIEEARFGSDGLLGRVSFSYGRTHPGDVLRPLAIEGDSIVVDARLAYPLVRARSLNITASGGANYVTENINENGAPLIRDSLSVLFARIGADEAFAFVPVILGGGLEVRKGLPELFGTVRGQDPFSPTNYLSRKSGNPNGFDVRGDARMDIEWAPYVSTVALFQGQYSWQPLLAFEEFSVGNLTIGRGYDPSVVSGHSGAGASAELHIGPFGNFDAIPFIGRVLGGDAISLYAFADGAQVWNRAAGGNDRTLYSAGGGIRIALGQLFQGDVYYAKPLAPISPGGQTPNGRIQFNVTMTY